MSVIEIKSKGQYHCFILLPSSIIQKCYFNANQTMKNCKKLLIVILLFFLSSFQLYAQSANDIAHAISHAAQQANIRSVVISDFYLNSRNPDEVVKRLRNRILSELAAYDCLEVVDSSMQNARIEEDAFEMESTPNDYSNLQAIIVGNLISDDEIPEGALHIKLVSTESTKILASVLVRIHLTNHNQSKGAHLPKMQNIDAYNMSRIREVPTAVAEPKSYPIGMRAFADLAQAEVVNFMVNSGIELYEREHYYLINKETYGEVSGETGNPQGLLQVSILADGSGRATVINRRKGNILYTAEFQMTQPLSRLENQRIQPSKDSIDRASGTLTKRGLVYTYTLRYSSRMVMPEKEVNMLTKNWSDVDCAPVRADWLNAHAGNGLQSFITSWADMMVGASCISNIYFPEFGTTYTYNGIALWEKFRKQLKKELGSSTLLMNNSMTMATLSGFLFPSESRGRDQRTPQIVPGVVYLLFSYINQDYRFELSPYRFIREVGEQCAHTETRDCAAQGFPTGSYRSDRKYSSDKSLHFNYSLSIKYGSSLGIPAEATLSIDLTPMKNKLEAKPKKPIIDL